MFLQCKTHYLSKYLQQRRLTKCMILGSGPTGLKMHDYFCENNIQVEAFIDIDRKLISRVRRNKPIHVISEETTSKKIKEFIVANDSIIISAVSIRGVRVEIRQYLQSLGLIESRDYIIAA
jgi:NADH/NAD ratio-sensing transcriptional regulator Rex